MRRLLCILLMVGLVLPQLTYSAETEAERRKRIEDQLQTVERQILQQRVLVEDKQLERQSLERDITIINGEIKKAELGVQARALAIASLTTQIGDKEEVIKVLNERLDKQKQSLAKIMRQTQTVDDISLVEVMLSNKNFSEFFSEVDSFHSVKESLNDSLSALEEIRTDTQLQKESLENKQETEAEMKLVQEMEQKRIEDQEAEKQKILTVTKGEEKAYQQLLQEQEKTAAQLRAQLFELLGGGGGIPFPQAVELAKTAGRLAGISPALILAILEQETNYGSNLGSCVYSDTRGGRPVMHPDRDTPVFLGIAAALGFNAERQQVSCPIVQGGVSVGWGGAMGPSQFIPSTWAIYGGFVNNGSGWQYSQSQDAIRTLLGKSSPANPFSNQDAFLATALLLRDNGAASSPRLSALRYYAGWGGASRPENQFYGDQVMQRMARLENEIRILGS
ncbi:lytic murein transglycosylase [Candidatus Kaiserbacteria bacterium]|nr:lytic murein transglycosylase [Candidatus Kaiserbacteria bacterium]